MQTRRSWLTGALLGGLAAGLVAGCGPANSGLEKPPPPEDLQPDMNKMPGFNEMQEKMKKKKGR